MKTSKSILFIICLCSLIGCRQNVTIETVAGDYELMLTANSATKIYFSGTAANQRQAYLNIEDDGIQLVLTENEQNTLLKSKQEPISYPCAVRILKNGNFFRFWVGNTTEWIRGPLGEWKDEIEPYITTAFQGVPNDPKWTKDVLKPYLEPYMNDVYAENMQAVSNKSFIIKEREWLKQADKTVLKYGPDSSFYEQQIIPGAILEYQGQYYMYFMAGVKGDEEGSSQRTIGLAVSSNLDDWTIYPKPVLTTKDAKYNNLYIGGAVVTSDNKIAIMYAVQEFPEWKGFMLATADKPEGPFKLNDFNPVYRHPIHAAHEFDLVDMKKEPVKYEDKSYRYLFFYAGFTPANDKMQAGDKGYLLYSNDLIHWVERKDNPVFLPETKDNWDVAHVRPRSLTKIDEYWYLWYEGVNSWTPPRKNKTPVYCDAIGLARSKDLAHWEYHPRNPVFAGTGQDILICGYNWVGWPRMVIKDKKGYVFFCGTHENKISTSYRTIDIEKLTDWESDYKK